MHVIKHIPYFSISTTLFYLYMKNLLPNIYLLNNKQGLNAHLNEIWKSKILFYNDYRHDVIMNFLLK